MKKIFLISLVIIGIFAIITIPLVSDQTAGAGSTKKIHFTKTVTSTQDPAMGHESHQLALILSPNEGTLYDGSMTFTANKPVQIVVLHEIFNGDLRGQPTWSVDGKTFYAMTLVDPKTSSGSFEFTGAALALHTTESEEFSATVSVDGWIRGQPTEVIMQKIQVQKEEPTLKLSRANVPAIIPLHKGLYNEKELYYIITDASDKKQAELISERQQWKVEVAPPLANTPQEALEKIYLFTNGLAGDGLYGYQNEVFSSTPNQSSQYSALRTMIEVTWKIGQKPEILDSEQKILQAKESGRIDLKEGAIINTPQIIWPEGQMAVRENKTISNEMEYGGAQILEIDTTSMTVTFVAHRGWGPDGQTIYYIVTDATPTGPAEMMGVVDSPIYSSLITSSAAVDLFQFKNGIKGSGPLGFQPGIATSMAGDDNYSPMWRIFLVEWNDPKQAAVLETKADIDALSSQELITVSIARPMNSEHIVNCPFIDPFQNSLKG